MNVKVLYTAAGFIVGAACGAGGMWLGLKKKFEDKAAKEISKARATFHRMLKQEREKSQTDDGDDNSSVEEETPQKPLIKEDVAKKSYSELLTSLGYTEVPEMAEIDTNLPYIIKSGMYGNGGLPTITLVWYVDDEILCREDDGRQINEIEDLLGEAGMDILSEARTDRFYIRNEQLKIDICVEFEYEGHYYEDHPEE